MTTNATAPTARPTVDATTLIRRPVAEVFAAFVQPELTTRFWFSKSSGRLQPGATVRWEWEMYGVADTVRVEEYVENERFAVRWDSDDAPSAGPGRRARPRALRTEFRFAPREEGTVVTVVESGFTGTPDEAIAYATNSSGGYTTALCGAKALLEHGIDLDAVRDKFPDAWV